EARADGAGEAPSAAYADGRRHGCGEAGPAGLGSGGRAGGPLGEGLVRCEDQTAFFVSRGDELEEIVRFLTGERERLRTDSRHGTTDEASNRRASARGRAGAGHVGKR